LESTFPRNSRGVFVTSFGAGQGESVHRLVAMPLFWQLVGAALSEALSANSSVVLPTEFGN